MDKKQASDAVCGAALAFGAVGLVAPRLLGKVIGIPVTDATVGPFRLIASRNVALGLIPRFIDMRDNYEPLLKMAAALNAADCVISLVSGARGQTPKRGAYSLALTTAGLAALAAVPVVQGH